MEKKERKPRGFYVEKGSFFVHAAVTVLILSMVARLLGTMTLWGDMMQLLVQIALPIGCAFLFILFILLLGRIALWSTILPVLGGAAFFILTVFDNGPGWPLFICIALAFLAAFVYTATLSGMIRSKWPLVIVFVLILAYQIAFKAIPAFGNMSDPVSFADGMTLLSSIGIVFAMFCASLALRRRKKAKTEVELPKIKDPVPAQSAEPVPSVDAPETEQKEEAAVNEADVPAAPPEAPAPEITEEIPASDSAESEETTEQITL